jgi:hypothetical protein
MSKKSRRRKQAARNEIHFQIEEKQPTRAFIVHPDMRAASPAASRTHDPAQQLEAEEDGTR